MTGLQNFRTSGLLMQSLVLWPASHKARGLVILSIDLEEALRMHADWAYLRSLGADHDMSAVAALPDTVTVA